MARTRLHNRLRLRAAHIPGLHPEGAPEPVKLRHHLARSRGGGLRVRRVVVGVYRAGPAPRERLLRTPVGVIDETDPGSVRADSRRDAGPLANRNVVPITSGAHLIEPPNGRGQLAAHHSVPVLPHAGRHRRFSIGPNFAGVLVILSPGADQASKTQRRNIYQGFVGLGDRAKGCNTSCCSCSVPTSVS
jgi:hypothetical protein